MSYEATMNALPPRAADWTLADMRRFTEEVHKPAMARLTNKISESLVCQPPFFKLDTLDREAQKVNGTTSLHKLNVIPGLGATVIDITDIRNEPEFKNLFGDIGTDTLRLDLWEIDHHLERIRRGLKIRIKFKEIYLVFFWNKEDEELRVELLFCRREDLLCKTPQEFEALRIGVPDCFFGWTAKYRS